MQKTKQVPCNRIVRIFSGSMRKRTNGPPAEELSDGEHQYGAGDGVAHLLIQRHGSVNGLAGDQLGCQYAICA